MTLDEMRQQLQMSKPSMSTGVKTTRIRYRQTTFTRGSRKQHFIAEKDFFTFFRNFFTKNGNVKLTLIWKLLKMQKISFTQFLKRMI